MRNHWHLYNWLKKKFMTSGRVPTLDEARAEFPELSLEQLGEGYAEFESVVGKLPEERSVTECTA